MPAGFTHGQCCGYPSGVRDACASRFSSLTLCPRVSPTANAVVTPSRCVMLVHHDFSSLTLCPRVSPTANVVATPSGCVMLVHRDFLLSLYARGFHPRPMLLSPLRGA